MGAYYGYAGSYFGLQGPYCSSLDPRVLWNQKPTYVRKVPFLNVLFPYMGTAQIAIDPLSNGHTYLIIVTDAADAVSVNFSGQCKFLQI